MPKKVSTHHPAEDAADILFADPSDTFSEDEEWTLEAQIGYAEFALIAAQSHLDELRAKQAAAEVAREDALCRRFDDEYGDCSPGDSVAEALNCSEAKIIAGGRYDD